jgi:hypothetical protein
MWPPLRDGLVQHLSGDRGHAEIAQNESITAFGKHGEGFTAISGRVCVMTEAGQEIHQEVTDLRFVVDDQDAMGQVASPAVAAEAVWSSFAVQVVRSRFQYTNITARSCKGGRLEATGLSRKAPCFIDTPSSPPPPSPAQNRMPISRYIVAAVVENRPSIGGDDWNLAGLGYRAALRHHGGLPPA